MKSMHHQSVLMRIYQYQSESLPTLYVGNGMDALHMEYLKTKTV